MAYHNQFIQYGDRIVIDDVTYEALGFFDNGVVHIHETKENVEGWLDIREYNVNMTMFLDKIYQTQKSSIWIDLEERLTNV